MARLTKQTGLILGAISVAVSVTSTETTATEEGRRAYWYFVSAEQLLEQCESDLSLAHLSSHDDQGILEHVQDKRTCIGYLQGIADALTISGAICLGSDTTIAELHGRVVDYLRTHPNLKRRVASQVVALALGESFSCP